MHKALSLGDIKGKKGWHCKVRAGVDLVEECHGKVLRYSASLPLQVAELNVILAALLLGEEGAEWVELGFGRIALTSNVHLVVPAVDEVRSDGCREPLRAKGWRHKAQANMALQGVAVGAAGGCPR